MATTRLRKTFKYPDDSDGSDISHDELDEEEQENLIASLRAKEAATNAQYNLVFSVLPLTVILPFLYYLFTSTTRLTALLCLLSITSLLASAYTMRFIPAESPAAPPQKSRFHVSTATSTRSFASADGPLSLYLPYLNPAISALLCVSAWSVRAKDATTTTTPEGLWLFLLLPAVVLGMVAVARRSVADVQAGIGELSGLRYDYRGA